MMWPFLLAIAVVGCTIKVEPIAKPKPKVKVVHHYGKHHKAHPHGTPAPKIHYLEPDINAPTKLIEQPTPPPSP